MRLISTQITSDQMIAEKFTCKGENISPPLGVENVPEQTKSLVLIVDDPDSPTGLWNHWLVWNIDPKTTEIKEGSAPSGASTGTNDFGKTSYGGPCPGFGVHRYFFRLLALDTMLNLTSQARRKELDAAIKNHVLAEASLMGRFTK